MGEKHVQMIAGAGALGCALASVVLAVNLTSVAGRARLTYTDRAQETDSPEVSLGIAMGAFRGLFVNMLWMRANDLKQEGKYYEAVDLSTAITRLQPRFPRVWVFHAWNLAYNISVQTQTPEERWNWVNQGIQLLRDKALVANPNDLQIHKELAWIYFHKVGGFTDDANTYYKRQLAAEWTMALGAPPPMSPETRTRAGATRVYAAKMRAIADAPESLERLLEVSPEVATLRSRLEALGLPLEAAQDRRSVLGMHAIMSHVLRSGRKHEFVRGGMGGERTKGAMDLVGDKRLAPAWDALLAHLRRRVLIDDYRMEPDRMLRYTERYGPIDWRLPAAHSLYWAARGVELAAPRQTKATESDYDFLNTDRVVAQSVQELFRTGELYFDFLSHVSGKFAMWQGVPNPSFATVYGEILSEMRARSFKYEGQYNTRGFSQLSYGYENFLIDVVLFHYAREGESEDTLEWYRKLREFPEMNLNDPNRYKRFSVPLPEFVNKEISDRATSPSVVINQFYAFLSGAFYTGLLGGNDEAFRRNIDYAALFHKYYFENQARRNTVDDTSFRMAQLDPDFPLGVGAAFFQFVGTLELDDAERAYGNAPNDLRLYAYDALEQQYRAQLDEEAKAASVDGARPFDVVFPKPDGLDSHRARIDRVLRERAKTIDTKTIR